MDIHEIMKLPALKGGEQTLLRINTSNIPAQAFHPAFP
jgi:hypothetical protein